MPDVFPADKMTPPEAFRGAWSICPLVPRSEPWRNTLWITPLTAKQRRVTKRIHRRKGRRRRSRALQSLIADAKET